MPLTYMKHHRSFRLRFSTFLIAWLIAARDEQLNRGWINEDDESWNNYVSYMIMWSSLIETFLFQGIHACLRHPDFAQEFPAIWSAYRKGVFQPIL